MRNVGSLVVSQCSRVGGASKTYREQFRVVHLQSKKQVCFDAASELSQ